MQQAPEVIDFSSMSQEAIASFLKTYQLALTVDEALTIQQDLLKRPPCFAECVLWSIQGSEHCSYKSTRKHLKTFVTEAPHVILGAKEDAGVVRVAKDKQGRGYGVVISHESHNHPSQVVPYEGAATGVGGNVRDVCCMGAEVVAVADSLRFGDISRSGTHWIQDGVVKGIAGYANPLGIPNIAGDVYYDEGYNDNCLVTVVTLGILREDHIIHSYAPKNAHDHVLILVGKPTDNSGFGGASFASATLDEEKEDQNKGAVQEPNAFLQRHLLKANYALFKILQDRGLLDKVGFKDLGAGGVACASVELADAAGLGAEIDLNQVPISMNDLMPAVTLCSETQERFMWVVPRELADEVLSHYNDTFALPDISSGARAAVVGKIRSDGLFVVKHNNQEIVNAKAADVTKGIVYDRPYSAADTVNHEPLLKEPDDFNKLLKQLLAHENIASRAAIFETYDKQVQGRTVVEAGWADAGVIQPFNDDSYPEEIQATALALSLDHNPRYNKIDAYWGAVNAVVESVRNVAATGATPLALTDCLCFGNPEKPAYMHQFVEAIKGISDACKSIGLKEDKGHSLPVVAGNVSLYNETSDGAIPPSPMISCLGVSDDVSKTLTYDLKQPDSHLLMIGQRKDECGGSVYYQLHDELGANLPKPDLTTIGKEVHTLSEAIQQQLILSVHDISDGGVAVALAEMSFKRQIGMTVEIPGELVTSKLLFSESGGFVLEVARDKVAELKALFAKNQVEVFQLGKTTRTSRLKINNVIDMDVAEALACWESGLREKLL